MRVEDIPLSACRAPEPPAPPLSDLWRGRAQGWWRFHLLHRLSGAAIWALFHVMRPLPPEVAAALGRRLGAVNGWIDRKRPYQRHMHRAVAMIRPDLDEAGREALLAAWWRQAGTTEALYPVLHKLARPARFVVHGAERLAAAEADPRPTFHLLVHLGSWELLGDMAGRHVHRPSFGIYEPQPNRFENRLVHRLRAAKGQRAFPPSPLLPRLMYMLIKGGANPALFIDEVSEGRCKFPLWGGPLPEKCNLMFLLRLAFRTGARLQPAHFLRDGPGRASLHLLAPVEPRPDLTEDAYVAETARALSAAFEPVIAANLSQWYMLKDMRVPVRPPRAGARGG